MAETIATVSNSLASTGSMSNKVALQRPSTYSLLVNNINMLISMGVIKTQPVSILIVIRRRTRITRAGQWSGHENENEEAISSPPHH